MRNAFSILLFASALMLAGCGGGGTSSTSQLRIPCIGGQSFCIISCDLGCNQTGCSVTQIAENQRLRFKFSDAVDPDSVNGASISIRTATGVAPSGDFVVNGNEVTFVPKASTIGGVSSFGFRRNESYIISLAGGNSIAQSVTNTAGDGLSTEFSCTVVAANGILDEDQLPPSVELVSPTVTVGAPVNPTIVLRFSELIDTTPLQTSLDDASPIRVVLRGILPNGECDSDSDGTALTGVPQLSTEQVGDRDVSVVTFQPDDALPGNSCITVRVTSDLRDLSGRSSVPAKFVFLTEASTSQPIAITETFADNSQQEVEISGGVWGGPGGGARPGLVGGDGRHGSFSVDLGQLIGTGLYTIDVDNTIIPASRSLTGLEYQVTDGRFFFTDFIVPEGTTIRFVGTVAPVIRVRGQVSIAGRVEVNGVDAPHEVPSTGGAIGERVSTFDSRGALGVVIAGQPGTLGGVGGAPGGDGGDEGLDAGPIIVNGVNVTQGQVGGSVQVRANHAYAGSTGNTGGRGSAMAPVIGEWPASVASVPKIGTIYASYFSPGGGGGGFSGPGGQADEPTPVSATAVIAFEPIVAGGVTFDLFPYPPVTVPPNYSSLDHFVVGGSGGGGGGSHGFGLLAIGAASERWMAGHGGTGGGGAIAIRSGGSIAVTATGSIEARGGDGCLVTGFVPNGIPSTNNGISSPGGGGSGGSILLQTGQDLSIAGNLNARGGAGSSVGEVTTPSLRLNGKAGDGADGFFRLEAPNGGVAFGGTSTPTYMAATNSGDLTDRDDLSGDTSLWYSSNSLFPPTWDRYELEVDIDGDGTIDEVYTDSGEPGTMRAAEPNGPVTLPLIIRFQGATLDGNNQPSDSPGPWRDGIGSGAGPGIGLDAVTGFRFTITYNRALFPNVVVRGLRVIAQS